MNIGLTEILIILFICLLLFGGRKLPEIAKGLGSTVKELSDIKREFETLDEGVYDQPKIDESLLIFLSSVMRHPDDLRVERDTIKSILNHEKLFSLWRFEDAPADDELEASYLDKVRECHIFILIVGMAITPPVRAEFDLARKLGKPILVFLKHVESREPETEAFILSLTSLGIRYKEFTTLGELKTEVLRATYQCVVKYYKRAISSKTYISCLLLLSLLRKHDTNLDAVIGEFDRKRKHGYRDVPVVEAGMSHVEDNKLFGESANDKVKEWGQYFYKKKNYQKALQAAKKLVEDDPSPVNHMLLAVSYENTGDKEKSISAAYEAYKLLKNKEKLTGIEMEMKDTLSKAFKEWSKMET